MPDGISMPPEAAPVQQAAPAQVYNPAAQEEMVQGLHPAAQYVYERAVATGAHPQEAFQAAQGKQSEMIQRATEGQNIDNVQQPVMGLTGSLEDNGFVSQSTLKRVQASLAE